MSIITRICLVVALLLGGTSVLYLIPTLSADKKELGEAKIAARKDADKAKAELKAVQAEAVAHKKEADEAVAKVAGLTAQVTEQTAKVTTLQGQIDELKKAQANMATSAAPTNVAELNDLKAKLAAAEQARDAAVQQAKETTDKIKALTDQVAAAEGEKKVINEKLKESDAKNRYYEGKDGVTLPEGLTGKVLYYDKAWNFTVLDIGKKKGVLPSGIMILHRGTEIVGKVRVATVDDDCCIADFIGDVKKKEPKAGDMAIP